MAGKIFIYSTLTSSTKYTNWSKGPGDLAKRTGSVLIQGGTNVANKHLVTPRGVVTEVSEDQLKILQGDKSFQRHVARGFIKVERIKAETIEKGVSDMVQRDPSAPLVPDDFDEEAAAAPKSGRSRGRTAPPPPAKA